MLRWQSSRSFLENGVLKFFRKFTVDHPCRSVISIKMQSILIEISVPDRLFDSENSTIRCSFYFPLACIPYLGAITNGKQLII